MTGRDDAGRSNLRQSHWVVISQGLNTGTNFLLSILVARAVDAAEFGVFAVTMVIYMLGVGVVRSSGNDVLSILHARNVDDLPLRARAVVSYAWGLGVVLALPCLGVGLLAGGSIVPYVVLSASFPLLLVQDALRGLAFAQGQPRRAALNDGLWALVQVGVVLVLTAGDLPALTATVVAWSAGGVVAAAVALVRFGGLPVRQAPHRWYMTNRKVAAPLLVSHVLTYLPANLTFLLMPAVTEVAELGTLRAAYLFFGPLGILILCLRSVVLPDAARITSPTLVRRFVIRVTCALCVVAAVWGAVIVVLPNGIGMWILGQNWDGTFFPRLFLAISLVAEAVMVGAVAALGTFRLASRVVRVQIVAAPLILALVLVLARTHGASGAAAGFAGGYWASAVFAWLQVPSRRQLAGDGVRLDHITDQFDNDSDRLDQEGHRPVPVPEPEETGTT